MIVLVDLDGVTADLEGKFWELWATYYPEAPRVHPSDRRTFYIEEQIGQEWTTLVRRIIHEEGFYSCLEPMPGALEGISTLQERGHEVIICTAPVTSPYCAPEKLEWVARHLGTEMATHMIISKDKTLVRGDVLFDDRPSITGKLQPVWTHILCDQPYNRSSVGPRATWKTLPEVIQNVG